MNSTTSPILLLLLLSIPAASAGIFLPDGTIVPPDQIPETIRHSPETESGSPFPIHFFFRTGCGSCDTAREYLRSYERKNPGIPIEYHNLAYDPESRELFTRYVEEYRNATISYPSLFIGHLGITGSSDIIRYTRTVVAEYQDNARDRETGRA